MSKFWLNILFLKYWLWSSNYCLLLWSCFYCFNFLLRINCRSSILLFILLILFVMKFIFRFLLIWFTYWLVLNFENTLTTFEFNIEFFLLFGESICFVLELFFVIKVIILVKFFEILLFRSSFFILSCIKGIRLLIFLIHIIFFLIKFRVFLKHRLKFSPFIIIIFIEKFILLEFFIEFLIWSNSTIKFSLLELLLFSHLNFLKNNTYYI